MIAQVQCWSNIALACALDGAIGSAIFGGAEMGGGLEAPLGALGVGTFLLRGRTRPRAPFQAEGAQIGAQGPASRGRQKTQPAN